MLRFPMLALGVLLVAAPLRAATLPLKPHAQLVEEVVAFLMSDVGIGGIRTLDGLPDGDPVPPYFYHYAIKDDDRLASSTNGYPGYASISYPGYTASVGIDAFLAWWAWSGDPRGLERARQFADWLLPRRTPATDLYAHWVYSTQTDGVMGGGFDGDALMSDKPGMFGVRLLRLYDITGDGRYLDAAREIADTYVATQRTGTPAEDGRWPFRVRPSDGLVRQDYTSHLMPAIRLLESMAAREPGGGHLAAAQRAWAWLEANPLDPASPDYMHWEGFYEDIAPEDCVGLMDHYGAENTLVGLLERGLPGDLEKAVAILDWSTQRYLAPDGFQNGYGEYDPALLEWDAWLQSTYAATGQWALANLRLEEATRGTVLHDPSWRSRGIEALHTLSYGQGVTPPPSDGRMLTTIRELVHTDFLFETWYEQNFNTVIYLLEGMGLAPELAPFDEDHLLRWTGGELLSIAYGSPRIAMRFGGPGEAWLRLRAQPRSVMVDGIWRPEPTDDPQEGEWSWDAALQLCHVVHAGGELQVEPHGAVAVAPPDLPPARLGAPRPNPFNPRVELPARIERAGHARLVVVDPRGRHVATLHDGWLDAGPRSWVWEGLDDLGRRVASGNYRAILALEGRESVRSLTLVR